MIEKDGKKMIDFIERVVQFLLNVTPVYRSADLTVPSAPSALVKSPRNYVGQPIVDT